MTQLRNVVFDALTIGQSAALTRTASERDIALFAATSGDINPAHMDPHYAGGMHLGGVVVHGMWTASLISAVLGTQLPGPGTIYLGQDLRFMRPVRPGEEITATVTVREKHAEGHRVLLDCTCTNAEGEEVLKGTATVKAPTQPRAFDAIDAPDVQMTRHARMDAWLDEAKTLPMLKVAVVHPVSASAITAAVEGREEGLFEPVLVGPEARIRQAADAAGVSLEGVQIESTAHSHAAAARAVEMAAKDEVGALMKGSLHTDELLAAVIDKAAGLRTDRWLSHVFVFDVPAYDKLVHVTDGALNIAPTLEQKRDIAQNAIDLARILGTQEPRVAVLAAVETVSTKMPATLDAAALTVMAARGQITDGRVDGPLAFDNAIDAAAAKTKGIASPVAGHADILLAPDLEAGNIAAKQLQYFAKADSAGIVLGAKVPIILTSRADGVRVRLSSAALARIVAARHRKGE